MYGYDWYSPARPRRSLAPVQRLSLLYHVYPSPATDEWRRNLAQLRRRLHIFNGQRLVGVVTGPGLAPPSEVGEYLDWQAEICHVPNDPPSDAASVLRLLPRLAESARDDAIFVGHTKGAGYPAGPLPDGKDRAAVRWWRNAMYHVLLDRIDEVRDALRTHPAVGAFQIIHPPHQPWIGTHGWHFSGSFYWLHGPALFARDWRGALVHDRYAGEALPGRLFRADEAFSLHQPFDPRTVPPPLLYHRRWHVLRIEDDPEFSVVVTCKGRLHHLEKTLPLWFLQETPPREVIVVDYGCPQGTRHWLASHYPTVRCVAVDADGWNQNHARNCGASVARGDVLVFADADFAPPPDWLSRVAEEFRRGARLVLHSYPYVHDGREIRYGECGQCAVARDLWQELRGFDERWRWAYSDIEFYVRARAAGVQWHRVWAAGRIPHSDEDRVRYLPLDSIDQAKAISERLYLRPDRWPINPNGYGRVEVC